MKRLRDLFLIMTFALAAFGIMPNSVNAATEAKLGKYTSKADSTSGEVASLGFVDTDNKVAERYQIRVKKVSSGTSDGKLAGKPMSADAMSGGKKVYKSAPVFKVTNDNAYKFVNGTQSALNRNSSEFNFRVIEKNYTLQKDDRGCYALLKLQCEVNIPKYLRQYGVGSNTIDQNFGGGKGYFINSNSNLFGRFGAHSIKSDGTQNSKMTLPQEVKEENRRITFTYTVNIGNFQMNENTTLSAASAEKNTGMRCHTYCFQYNRLAVLYSTNEPNNIPITKPGASWYEGYYRYASGKRYKIVKFDGKPLKLPTAGELGISKTGQGLVGWRNTANGKFYNTYSVGGSYQLKEFAIQTTSGYPGTLFTVDSDNKGFPFDDVNNNITVLTGFQPVWTDNAYLLYYDIGVGSLNGKSNPTQYTVNTPTFTLNNPVAPYGMRFDGWEGYHTNEGGTIIDDIPFLSDPNGDGGVETATITQGTTGHKFFKAIYGLIDYDITYDLGVGTKNNDSDNPYRNYTYGNMPGFNVHNETFHIYEPVAPRGYKFIGWTGTHDTQYGTEILPMLSTLDIQKGSAGNYHLVANYAPIDYDIDYDLNDGHMKDGEENPYSYNIETPTFTIKNPERDHYNFAGWIGLNYEFYQPRSQSEKVTKGTIGNITFEAKWTPIIYPITYDLQGGTEPTPGNPTQYTVETPDFSLNSPTRKGYTFAGWSGTDLPSSPDADGNYRNDVTIGKGSYGARHYIAHWKRTDYKIKYEFLGIESNEHPENSKNPTSYNIETPTFSLYPASLDHYKFLGWSFTKSNNDNDFKMDLSIEQGTTGNLTIYGVFKRTKDSYRITFDPNGGKTNLTENELFYYEDENYPWGDGLNKDKYIKIKNGSFTKNAYEFVSWNYKDGKVFKPTDIATSNVTVYAKWTPIIYPVTYDLQGGNPPIPSNPDSVTVETPDTPLNNPTRDGYEFVGWTGSNGTTPNTNTVIYTGTTSPLHYVANWKPCAYKITYDLQGGKAPVPDNPTGYSVDTPTFTLNNPTKEGYKFVGWTGSNGSVPTNPTSVQQGTKGDLHFVANWKEKDYKITYILNGGKDPKNRKKYRVDTPTFTLKNPTKKGYIFTGWKGTEIPSSSKKVTIKKGSVGKRVYEAIWEPKMSKLPRLKATDKEINLGSNSYRFIVYGENKKGGKKHVWKAVDMKGKPSKVISVSKNGTIKTKKCGKAMVQYKLYDKKGRMIYGFQSRVKVINTSYKTLNTSKKIKVKRPTLMFDKTITVKNKKGFPLKWMNRTKGSKVTYKSSNKKVLTVSKNGIAKAKKAGFSLVSVTLKQDGVVYNYKIHFKCETSLNK